MSSELSSINWEVLLQHAVLKKNAEEAGTRRLLVQNLLRAQRSGDSKAIERASEQYKAFVIGESPRAESLNHIPIKWIGQK